MKVARQFIAWNRAEPKARPVGYGMVRVRRDIRAAQ